MLSQVFVLLASVCLLCATQISCECIIPEELMSVKEFPDINVEGKLSYQLSVQVTTSNDNMKRTDFFREYRDISNKKMRVDAVAAGNITRYYYYNQTDEQFMIHGDTCVSLTSQAIPDFMREGVTDWEYENVRGPSAMFLWGLKVWKNKNGKMVYIGTEENIRGLKADHWRRCYGEQSIDYYFTSDEHEDLFGFENLKQIPLRVQFGESGTDKFLPQTYDIMSFQPFVSDKIATLAIPAGIGCRRSEKLDDVPTVPDFSASNLLTFGEASYIYGPNDNNKYNYYSTFMFAVDQLTSHMAYFYTPWGNIAKEDGTIDSFIHISYDMKNKYMYRNNLATDQCTISREDQFMPRYYLPQNGGYIDLTDPMMFYPNNEFRYISDNKDRGFDVHTFEATMGKFPLGNRTVEKVIVTHNYLKDNEVIDNVAVVKNTTLSMKFKFFNDSKKPHTEELTINLFGFTTQIDYPQFVFGVSSCMKNDDDFLYVTIGFAADKKIQEKIQSESRSIQKNLLASIIRLSELNPLRIPNIFIDFDDMIYVTIVILDKPPVVLDYLAPESGKTISGSSDSDGIMSLDGCATACLESEVNCWGFSYCGSTCYYGIGENSGVSNKEGCKLYRRYSNSTYVQSKETAANNLKSLVKGKLKIAVPNLEDGSKMPEFLEASYFAIRAPGESEEIFGLLGKQTNPRLRVVKTGYKLVKSGETIKNFGTLRYDQCQKLCLDYRRCETVSYCVKDSQCVLSLTYADDLPKDAIQEDTFCNLLTKKYTDHFDRSPGDILSQKAKKVLPLGSPEDCARACLKEKTFECLSFDLCPDSDIEGCRLHASHLTDINKENGVTKQLDCGHYSKKFSYQYRKESNKKSVGVGFLAATDITLEECAKMCDQLESKTCYGYDFCGDKTLTSTSCYLLDDDPASFKTTYSAICNHFVQRSYSSPARYSSASAAWIGVVTFFVAVVVGVLVTFGVGYYRANKAAS